MSDKSNIGKGFLKDKLGEYQVIPPESVWNSISASLGGRSRRRLYVLALATAASVALAITLGINFFGPAQVDKDRLGAVTQEETVSRSETLSGAESGPEEGALVQAESSSEEGALVQAESGSRVKSRSQTGTLPDPEVVAGADEISKVQSRDRTSLRDKVSEAMATITEDVEPYNEGDKTDLATLEQEVRENDPSKDSVPVLILNPGDDLPLDQVPMLEPDPRKDPRWMVGAVMSPLYSFRDAEGQAMAGGQEYESGLISYAGGINVSYRGNSRLAIESGIHFSKMGLAIGAPGIQVFNKSYDYAPMRYTSNSPELIAITNSVGNIVAESGDVIVNGYKLNAEFGEAAISNADVGDFAQVAEQGIEQHLDYLELPFNLRYTVVDRTFELQVVGGMSTNFLVNNTVTMETSSGPTEIGYLTNIRNVNYSGNAGIGMIYHIHQKFSLQLEPRFRYFLNSVNDASLPNTRPYAFGIYTGINYTF
ncbi:MAG: hypothetical protein ABFS28_15825 [Bacteroidota bacterium]